MKQETIYRIDQIAYQSVLRKWNPMGKFIFVLLAIFSCLMWNQMKASLFLMAGMAVLNVVRGKLSVGKYLKLLAVPVTFVLLASIATVVEYQDGHLWVTVHSVYRMCQITVKALASVSALYFLALTTPIGELIGVFHQLHVPELMIELMHLIYRYIFILMDSQSQMRMASESRLGYCDYPTSCKTFGSNIGNLFLIALKKSRTYYQAMESRGYDGNLRLLEECHPLCREQIVWFIGILAGMTGIAFL